jgi:L-lysine exporter family protein LysE/ArgO
MIQYGTPFLLGLVLGLALIIPIGVQSLFVLDQGLSVGFPRALLGVAAVCSCDTVLILLGAAGASALLALLGYEELLIGVGSAYLLVAGVLTLRARARDSEGARPTRALGATVLQAVGVSVLNPHAVLDTLGVLGAAISAQAAEGRVAFVAGAVGASWVWYTLIGAGASVLGKRITPRVRTYVRRASGAIMLVLAGVLASGLA